MAREILNNLDELESRKIPGDQRIVLVVDNLSLRGFKIEGVHIPLPDGNFSQQTMEVGEKRLTVSDFSEHPMNMRRRYGEMTDPALLAPEVDMILISLQDGDKKFGLVVPREVKEGSVIAHLRCDGDQEQPFTISLFEIKNEELMPIASGSRPGFSKILHGTQILGHIKDACDMQANAHEKGSLQNWEFAFPPTKRRSVNQAGLISKGIPTHEITRNWSYSPETEELMTDFSDPASFDTVMGFLAANIELCGDVARGSFDVLSTNFKQEGNVLKLLSPESVLVGINFTFLEGTPGERIDMHKDLPKFQRMLRRVQDSLDSAPQVLERLSGRKMAIADWWRITEEKMQTVDILLYRTFSKNEELPTRAANAEVVQVPHPIPEIGLGRDESRMYVGRIIGEEILDSDKLIILAGESGDGSFVKRVEGVIDFARSNEGVKVITPMAKDDKRLTGFNVPPNVFTIGFREDWMDIIPAGDATFIRGSWGEILDVVASGNVPIISSPGVVPSEGEIGDIQFFNEVSGERATNLSLFIKELQAQGVSSKIIEGLLCDISDFDSRNEIESALVFALSNEASDAIRDACLKIRKDGIPWMVELHEQILDSKRRDLPLDIDKMRSQVW